MANGDFPTRSMLCHSMTMIISNSLENVRKLITLNSAVNELDRLYTIDPLCGIYNRTGFIRTADEKFQMCKLRGEKAIIAFVDMDGLKNINDKYGHKEGDYGLKKLAEVLSDCCKEGWFCARFGGDEFILFGENASDRDAEELCSNFEKRLEMINNTGNKPYKISASIGTVVSDINEEQSLFGIINQADEIMYEQKKRKPSRYIRK
jgi:diguanylate cyclase (GGDEF)-like protein